MASNAPAIADEPTAKRAREARPRSDLMAFLSKAFKQGVRAYTSKEGTRIVTDYAIGQVIFQGTLRVATAADHYKAFGLKVTTVKHHAGFVDQKTLFAELFSRDAADARSELTRFVSPAGAAAWTRVPEQDHGYSVARAWVDLSDLGFKDPSITKEDILLCNAEILLDRLMDELKAPIFAATVDDEARFAFGDFPPEYVWQKPAPAPAGITLNTEDAAFVSKWLNTMGGPMGGKEAQEHRSRICTLRRALLGDNAPCAVPGCCN